MTNLPKTLLSLILLVLTLGNAFSQINATCQVKASFSPGNDTVSSIPFIVYFTNTSTNATSIKWLLNGFEISSDNFLNYGFNMAGSYEIKLVASDGACSDTAICYVLQTGTQPLNRDNFKAYYGLPAIEDNATCITAATSGGYLMGGYSYFKKNQYTTFSGGLLIKTAESGCIEWSKMVDVQYSESKIITSNSLADGGFIVSATQEGKPFMMKLDAGGNLIWAKEYFLAEKVFQPQLVIEADDGGLVMAGTFWADAMIVVRTDANGNMLWNRVYKKYSSNLTGFTPITLLQKGNDVYFSGEVVQAENENTDVKMYVHGFLLKLNDATGETRWSKEYITNGSYTNVRDIHFYNDRLLMNSFATAPVANFNNTINFLDTAGTALSSSTLSTPGLSYGTFQSNLHPLPNGDIYVHNSGVMVLPLQPYFALQTNFIKLDADLNFRWGKNYSHNGAGAYTFSALGGNSSLAVLGNENGTTLPVYTSLSRKMQFLKMDSSGNPAPSGPGGNYCDLYDLTVSVSPQSAIAQPLVWSADTTFQMQYNAFDVALKTMYSQVHYVCPNDFIDSCSFIKVTGPGVVCNLNDTLVYKVHRNKECFQPVQWDIPVNATIISQSDTELALKVNSFGNFYVGALLPFSCTPVKDSLLLEAKTFGGLTLELGSDTSLCTGNTLQLDAGQGFLNYVWNDGSIGRYFEVKEPGQYSVSVLDSCQNILRDTLLVMQAPSVPLTLGADRIKCNDDTLHIDAPDGFMNYSWSPNYTINSTVAQHVIVNPQADTAYVVKAEKTPGCFGSDTVRIKVYKSPLINLGADTSFCKGEQVSLFAGNNFKSYEWNTGATTVAITVNEAGSYNVIATTNEGCISTDAIVVKQLYELPVLQLNKQTYLCEGEARQLDPGNFKTYKWNNGTVERTITINTTGTYAVQVTDNNGCNNKDSVVIASILPVPKNFLTSADSICQYGELQIKPSTTFKSYLWSNGSSGSAIEINAPGIYWLEATDQNSCSGKDSIIIYPKECMIGLYVPSAFTPNNDGKNDLFRTLLFGNIIDYRFTIYNRWGEIVFTTKQAGEGWNGKWKSQDLKTDVFIWTCTYQLKGEKAITKKGTVTLIR